jgi:NADPH-dependent curcumin reductase CurA
MTSQTNRQFLLAKRPVGAATRETFTYQEVPVGEPAAGRSWSKTNTCPSTRPCVAG